MKHRILAMLTAAAISAGTAVHAHADAVLVVSPESTSIGQGTAFGVDVNISGVTDLYGWQFDLTFTPGTLSAGPINEGQFLVTGGSTFFIPGTVDNLAGSISGNADSLLSAISGVTGSGTLATFDFTAQAPGAGTLTLSNVQLLDSSLNPISASISSGMITVTPVPTPSTFGLLACGLLALLGAQHLRQDS